MNKAKPLNQVLLRVDKALNDEIITDSGLKLYIDPTYRKEWCSAVTATIVDLPTKVSERDKKILKQLKIGDEVCISYQVVADFEFVGDGDRFMPATEENHYVKEFINGKGDWIRCYALPNRRGIAKIMWAGVYQNKFKKVVSGVQGTESELDRWLAQFPLGKTDIYSFNNLFEHKGKSYWKCDLSQIFAKKEKGKLIAVGDRIICEPVEEDVPTEVKIKLSNITDDIKIRYQDRGIVVSGGKIKSGSIVSFSPNHCERYEFYGKPFFLIKQNFVQGVWQN